MYAVPTSNPLARTTHQPALHESPADFWGEPIHTYTRAQAIADGLLVDATVGDLAQVSRQHFGDPALYHVAMTARLFALIERAVNHPHHMNDYRGVWHDICFMSIVLPERKLRDDYSLTVWFKVIITGTGRIKKHLLKRVMTPDGHGGVEITFMLADED
jgi:hypothetical protein